MLKIYSRIYGYQISKGTIIGPGFLLVHRGTVVINRNVKIGSNCSVFHNVTIGAEYRGCRKGSPSIGNRVWIGAGAVIVGAINIGNDVLIAPNSFVNTDVPDHSIVIGNPCLIKHKHNATQYYIS